MMIKIKKICFMVGVVVLSSGPLKAMPGASPSRESFANIQQVAGGLLHSFSSLSSLLQQSGGLQNNIWNVLGSVNNMMHGDNQAVDGLKVLQGSGNIIEQGQAVVAQLKTLMEFAQQSGITYEQVVHVLRLVGVNVPPEMSWVRNLLTPSNEPAVAQPVAQLSSALPPAEFGSHDDMAPKVMLGVGAVLVLGIGALLVYELSKSAAVPAPFRPAVPARPVSGTSLETKVMIGGVSTVCLGVICFVLYKIFTRNQQDDSMMSPGGM